MDSLHTELKKYWGYSTFLPQQESIVRSVLAKNDTLAIMTTGGGKSLCYQLPAVCLGGVTLVISPLISLMKDQVDDLNERGILAAAYTSALAPRERDALIRILREGTLTVLYASPERCMQQQFLAILKESPLSLIAVDEAHCISEWGHDFRPEYRRLLQLRQHFSEVPVIALTATAIPDVRDDICRQLGLVDPQVFVSNSDRKNLQYRVIEKRNPLVFLYHYIGQHRKDSGIVYCMSRNECDEIAGSLKKRGFAAQAYHAGLSPTIRSRVQESFLNGTTRVVCATVAFGMGVDKPDVRYIIHHSLSKSLESYCQETGRAGRDGQYSECILLYSPSDAARAERMILQDPAGGKYIRAVKARLQKMIEYCEDRGCRRRFILAYFGEEYEPGNCGSCDNCEHPPEMINGTVPARLILTAITQSPEPPDATLVIAVLRGWKGSRIKERGLDALPAWGTGKKYPAGQYRIWIDELIRQGFLDGASTGSPGLRVTGKGFELMKGRYKVMLPPFIR